MPAYKRRARWRTPSGRSSGLLRRQIVVVDDHSGDDTVARAQALNLKAIRHPPQRRLWRQPEDLLHGGAARRGHDRGHAAPDGQYDPAIIPEMIRPIREGRAEMVLGSRMLVPGGAKQGGMPLWKRVVNRSLTTLENLAMAPASPNATPVIRLQPPLLETVPFLRNSNSFVFDTQVIFQAVHFGLPVVEVPVASRYFGTPPRSASATASRTASARCGRPRAFCCTGPACWPRTASGPDRPGQLALAGEPQARGALVREMQAEGRGQEDGHLPPRHRAVRAVVAAAAAAADPRGRQRFDEAERTRARSERP